MQFTKENKEIFINLWNENKPKDFIHPMRDGIANVIFDAFDLAEYTVNFENGEFSLYDNQTDEDLGNISLKDLYNKAKYICESDYKEERSSRTFGNNILDIFANKELSPEEYKEQIRDELEYFYQSKLFNTNNKLNWNTIDHTTKKWMDIDDRYHEYDESKGFLSIAYSLNDLESDYGSKYFPGKAIEDGNLKTFDVYREAEVEDYLRKKYDLKDSEEINELLWDYEYQTKDLLKYYIPNLSNENAELLSVIIDTQYIYLDHLTSITFENIYNKIDESKLTEVQLEELNKIKEELSKPTVEVFKEAFESFIQTISFAAADSINEAYEKLKAKALYVYHSKDSEYTIVSKKDGKNTFMVHKYYPTNENGGLHHGAYNISFFEIAEKNAIGRVVDLSEVKYDLVKFVAGTREDEFNRILKDDLASVVEYVNEYVAKDDEKIELVDVKAHEYGEAENKIKVLVEYKGKFREDDLFAILNEEDENLGFRAINGCVLDLNPINPEKSGTISEYLAMLKNLVNEKEYTNKEQKYFQDLNKLEKAAVIRGYWEAPDPEMYDKVIEEFYYNKGLKEPNPGLVQYPGDEWIANYLTEKKIDFNTEYWNPIFEIANRIATKDNFELKVGDRVLISDDKLYGKEHSEELGYYELSCFEVGQISKQKDKVMLKRFSGMYNPQEPFEIEKLIKNKEELDEYLTKINTEKGFLLENNGDIKANNKIRIIPITKVKEHEFNDSYIVSGTGGGTYGEFEISNLENQTLRKNPYVCNFDYRKDVKSATDFLLQLTNIREEIRIEKSKDFYEQYATTNPKEVYEELSSFGKTVDEDKLAGYLKGLSKSNNYNHYLDELMFDACVQSDETLFSKIVDAGADLTWRREENGEPINILHYAAADNLSEAVQITINKLSEDVELINLLMEENYEGKKPFEVSVANFSIEYHETQENLLDTLSFERDISSFLFRDESGNQLLYEVKNNGGVERILFDYNNEIVNYDVIYNDNSFGKIVFDDLSQQIKEKNFNESFIFDNTINNIEKLQNIPQKLWNDEINYRILLTIPNTFNPRQSFYDFDSILAFEKIKKNLFSEFDNQKEALLQGLVTKKDFVASFEKKELKLEDSKTCELINFFKDDNWSPVHESFKNEIAAVCFDKKFDELLNSISPRPNLMGMFKDGHASSLCKYLNVDNCKSPISEDEAEIILKYIQYEDYNFYKSVDGELCLLDVSEDFTGEGEKMTPAKVVDFAYQMMAKARDYEYSIYDVKDEEVICNLRKQLSSQITESVSDSKSTVQEFFSKLKDSLYENAPIDVVLKSAGTVLQSFSDTEKKEISQYLQNKGASSGDKVGKVLSEVLSINEQKQKKIKNKADDDTRGR